MHEDEQLRVVVEQKAHPAVIYCSPISYLENKAFVDRYQTSTPSLGERSNEVHKSEASEPTSSHNSHSTSPSRLGYAATYPSPDSDIRHPVKFHRKHCPGPSNNIVTPILLPLPEKDTWNRVSKAGMNMTAGTVKRSVSTPNVQQAAAMSTSASGVQFSTDKRRNKLGYHRTSVACGHCRRRKIRCLLQKDDSHGRCINCIRLKKECNFYPVETTDRRPRSLSKPDISTNEASSSTSSPSPGIALGKLPRPEIPGIYAASVPVTPTYDYHHGILEDSIRHNSISSVADGRLSISHSIAASRRPSLAHIIPSLKKEHDYLTGPGIDSPSFPRVPGFRMNSVSELSASQPDQRGLESAFYRLASPMSPNPYSIYGHHVDLGSMTSLHSATPSESQEDTIWPSRMNSIDTGLLPTLYPNYTADADCNRQLPGFYNTSASASTTSLPPPMPEISPFAESRVANQLFMTPWVDALPTGTNLNGNAGVKSEAYDGYYPPDVRYQEVVEGSSGIFPSPLQSPKFVSQV